jgi:hypothetical protein
MKKIRSIFILISFVYISSAAHANDLKFVFEYPVQVFEPSPEGLQNPSTVAAGNEIPFAKDKAYWIQAKGKVPLLVLPQAEGKFQAPLKVQLPDVLDWPSYTTQREIDTKLAELVEQMTAFQTAVRKKDVADAERILARMESIARLDYFNFMRATIRYLQGDIEGAKTSTRKGLRRYPANEQGQSFLKSLGGDQP